MLLIHKIYYVFEFRTNTCVEWPFGSLDFDIIFSILYSTIRSIIKFSGYRKADQNWEILTAFLTVAVNRFQVDLTHFSEPFDQVAMLPPL